MSAIPAELAKLSITERIQLVEDLWDSIAAEAPEAIALTDSQRDELRRRWQAHRDDPAAAVSWDEVRGDILARGG
jgi:putative addiction module component (TIGR02574 family)